MASGGPQLVYDTITDENTKKTKYVIMLHGYLGNRHSMKDLAMKVRAGWTVVVPDLRNHGDSPHHKIMSYSVMADDIV